MNTSDTPPTADQCFANAARLLENAGMTLDREMMDKLDTIARTWISMGAVLLERDSDTVYN